MKKSKKNPSSKPRTHKGAQSRMWITGTGKVMRRKQNRRHLVHSKSKRQMRDGKIPAIVEGTQAKKIKLLLNVRTKNAYKQLKAVNPADISQRLQENPDTINSSAEV